MTSKNNNSCRLLQKRHALAIALLSLVSVVAFAWSAQSIALQGQEALPISPEERVYLDEVIPPCTLETVPGQDPCDPDRDWRMFRSFDPVAHYSYLFFNEYLSWPKYQEHPSRIAHIILRGTGLPGTARCHNVDVEGYHRFSADEENNVHSPDDSRHTVNCYIDIAVQEYISGAGAPTVTLGVYDSSWHAPDVDASYKGSEDLGIPGWENIRTVGDLFAAQIEQRYAGRESIFFIQPSFRLNSESWRVLSRYRVVWNRPPDENAWLGRCFIQVSDICAVSDTHTFHSFVYTLPFFVWDVHAMHNTLIKMYDGKINAEPGVADLVLDTYDLNSFFRQVGAYEYPGFTPEAPPPIPTFTPTPTPTPTFTPTPEPEDDFINGISIDPDVVSIDNKDQLHFVDKNLQSWQWSLMTTAHIDLKPTWPEGADQSNYRFALEVPKGTGLQIAYLPDASCKWESYEWYEQNTTAWFRGNETKYLVSCALGEGNQNITVKVKEVSTKRKRVISEITVPKPWHISSTDSKQVKVFTDCLSAHLPLTLNGTDIRDLSIAAVDDAITALNNALRKANIDLTFEHVTANSEDFTARCAADRHGGLLNEDNPGVKIVPYGNNIDLPSDDSIWRQFRNSIDPCGDALACVRHDAPMIIEIDPANMQMAYLGTSYPNLKDRYMFINYDRNWKNLETVSGAWGHEMDEDRRRPHEMDEDSFSGGSAGNNNPEHDLASVIIRELIHAVGPGHSPNTTDVMYYTLAPGITSRTLKMYELNALSALYGTIEPETEQ